MPPVLSLCFFLSLAASIHWFAQSCCEATNASQQCWDYFLPVVADRNLHMLQTPSHQRRDAWPTNCTPNDAHSSVFLYFQYSICKTHSRHFRTFRWAILLVTSCFFRCCYERNSIYKASLSHFISVVHSAHHLFFLSSRRRLLDSGKRRLFCLHIQHATRCLFERRTPVGSLEAAVCRSCLSISLQVSKLKKSSVLNGTLDHLMVRLQPWCFGEYGVLLHCHCSQVHSDSEWKYLIESYLWVK